MMRVTYGIEVSETDITYDNIIKDVSGIMAITGVPGTFMVDYLPQCRNVLFISQMCCSYTYVTSEISS